MIILFEQNEKDFDTLGLGVLIDATSCIVTEELNGSFELEMVYPITGAHYTDISLKKIILASPNMYDRSQPFRIYSITKPINGLVTINAEHISYDMSGYIVKAFDATSLQDAITKINQNAFPNSPFILSTDKLVLSTMKTDKPYSQRSLLAGQTGSLLDIYGGEYVFDRYDITLLNARGRDRGITIRYGKNLIDLEQETISSKIYTGIFPFYSATISETKTVNEMSYQSVYIVNDTVPFAGNWLSLSDGGKALIPLLENAPVQIKREEENDPYYDMLCYFKRASSSGDNKNIFNCYIRPDTTILSADWLSLTDGGTALIPTNKTIYKVDSEGDYLYKTYIWNGSNYVEFTGTGFYYSYIEEELPIPEPTRPKITIGTEEKEVYKDLTEIIPNGIIYIDGKENEEPKKILNLDLTDKFSEVPTIEELENAARKYLTDNNLKDIQKSLTVSFIKLSDTEEYKYLKDLEVVALGDSINVHYDKLGVDDSNLKVILTEFNVLSGRYNEIELGTKTATLTDSAITTGDGISSLTNDANYADKVSVVNLMAENLTADYITGKNANLTQAQIEQLKTERIEVAGMIEASEGYFDRLMAQLLVAENAEIKNKLVSGEIEVKGKITATSGEIKTEIKVGDDGEGGYNFQVDKNGKITAKSGDIGNCKIDENGNLIISTSIELGETETPNEYNFSVDKYGNVLARSFTFKEGGLSIENGVFTADNIEFVNGSKITSEPAGIDYEYQTVNFYDITARNHPSFENMCEINMRLSFYDKNDNEIVSGETKTNFVIWVAIEYRRAVGEVRILNREILIPIGTGSTYSSNFLILPNITIIGYVGPPSITKKETLSGTPGAISVNTHFLPESGSSDLNIGSHIGEKWDTIFVKTVDAETMIYSSSLNIFGGECSIMTPEPATFSSGIMTTGGSSSFGGNILAGANGQYDIGDSAKKFRNIYATNGVIQTSDRVDKSDINYELDKYDNLFDMLKPSSFKIVNGTSGRTHLGFISQDVEEALKELDISSTEFAGFIKSLKDEVKDNPPEILSDNDYIYGLRYDEFHAMEVREIQKLKKEVKMLKQELKELRDLIK